MTSTTKADDAPPDETMHALVDLKVAGKIRHIGASNVNLTQLKAYRAGGHLEFVQNRFSFLNRSVDLELQQYCSKHGLKLLPYQVIERGLLTDRLLEGLAFREHDLRSSKPEFRPEAVALLRSWASAYLKPISDREGISLESMFIWWASQQPNVRLCVVGATNPNQLRRSMRRVQPTDPAGLLQELESVYQRLAVEIYNTSGQSVSNFLGNVY